MRTIWFYLQRLKNQFGKYTSVPLMTFWTVPYNLSKSHSDSKSNLARISTYSSYALLRPFTYEQDMSTLKYAKWFKTMSVGDPNQLNGRYAISPTKRQNLVGYDYLCIVTKKSNYLVPAGPGGVERLLRFFCKGRLENKILLTAFSRILLHVIILASAFLSDSCFIKCKWM